MVAIDSCSSTSPYQADMPMQPSPSADTTGPCPSVLVSILRSLKANRPSHLYAGAPIERKIVRRPGTRAARISTARLFARCRTIAAVAYDEGLILAGESLGTRKRGSK